MPSPMSHLNPVAALHRHLLLLVLFLAVLVPSASAQNPSFSNTVFTPESGATLRVGDTLKVSTTVTNAPTQVRLNYGPTGTFLTSFAGNLTALGSDRFEINYTVKEADFTLSNNGTKALDFQLSAVKGATTVTSFNQRSYTIAAADPNRRPDLTVALANGESLKIVTAGSDVRLSAGVVISNGGTAPAANFAGTVVLSTSPTFSITTLLRNPADGQIFLSRFLFSEFARSAGQPVTELPANGSFDPFTGSLTLPATTYAAILAQSPVPLYAFAVVDIDGTLAESNENNNALLLGRLVAPGTTGGGPAPFTVDLKGVKEGDVIAPGTEVAVKAKIRLPDGVTATIAKVDFFVDGELAGTDTEAAYKFTRTFTRPRSGTLTAVATDTEGRSATSAPVRFRVAAGAAGPLALDTEVEPGSGTVTPGTVIAYTFTVTNTGQTFTAGNVAITAPVPNDTNLDSADVPDNGGSREVAADKRSVTFRFNDIPAKESRRARLFVRLPFDARVTNSPKPITTDDVLVVGLGFGGVAVSGRFEPTQLAPVGPLPTQTPRLALLKALVDRDEDPADDLDSVDDPILGPIPAVGEGGVLTVQFLAVNNGDLPAQKVTVKDRVPDGFEVVPGSARVNDTAAGGVFKVNGRTVKFKMGDFQAGEVVGPSYQIRKLPRVQGEPVGRLVVESRGAEISSNSLRGAPDSAPAIIPIRIVGKSVPLVLETYAQPAQSVVGQPQTYVVRYRNEGKTAKGAMITATLPAGTTFRSATNGGQVQGDGRTVAFPLGDVAREARGEVSLVVDVTPAVLDNDNRNLTFSAVPSDNKFVPRTVTTAGDPRTRGSGPVPRVDNDDLQQPVVERNPILDPRIPRLGVIKYAPQSVKVGGTFAFIYTVVNHSAVTDGFVQVAFAAPAGAEFDSFISPTGGATINRNAAGYTLIIGELKPQQAQSIIVKFRATAPAGTRIDEGRFVSGSPSVPLSQPRLSTLVIDGDATAPDNQTAIVRAQLEALGLDAPAALADPAVRARTRLIGNDSGGFKIAGLDYIQLNNGALAIPIGAGQMVAAGGGNLIGNDGSTLIGNDGSTLIALGAASQLRFNGLIGNDGSTLVGNDGASLISENGLGLIARSGLGNLVNAGGLNLIGNDGSTLIGNDGSTLRITVTSLITDNGAGLVAARAGNVISDNGLGLVNAGGLNFISDNGLGLVSARGGAIVAAGGGNLVSPGGGSLFSRDASRAIGLGANGTFTVGGGGGLVSPGGGN